MKKIVLTGGGTAGHSAEEQADDQRDTADQNRVYQRSTKFSHLPGLLIVFEMEHIRQGKWC